MIDFRNITTQEDLEELFKHTSFHQYNDCAFGNNGNAIKITDYDDGEDGKPYQHVWIGECEYMGCITVADFENHGYDALFVQTIVQLFRDGKLKLVEG